MTVMLCVNTLLRKEEEIIKVHVLKMKHMSTDKLGRRWEEEELDLIRILDEEEHLRSEHREL